MNRFPTVSALDVHKDDRGHFFEAWRQGDFDYFKAVQTNISFSKERTIRGLHFQSLYPQAKLLIVLSGKILDACVDIRIGSPNFGEVYTFTLGLGESWQKILIPKGFAHGFEALEDSTIMYQVDEEYHPEYEKTINFDDGSLGIEWHTRDPIVSAKDLKEGFTLLDIFDD
jgi:dTDP-4-dehydrorhamnose 3,5-epimerase